MSKIARFKLGNEIREGKYWKGDEERRCRLCGMESESWEHLLERCRKWWKGGRKWLAGDV